MQITCHKNFVKVMEFFINSNFTMPMYKIFKKFITYCIWFFNIYFNGIEFLRIKLEVQLFC